MKCINCLRSNLAILVYKNITIKELIFIDLKNINNRLESIDLAISILLMHSSLLLLLLQTSSFGVNNKNIQIFVI